MSHIKEHGSDPPQAWGVNETSKFEGIKTFEDGEIDDDVDLVVSDEIEDDDVSGEESEDD